MSKFKRYDNKACVRAIILTTFLTFSISNQAFAISNHLKGMASATGKALGLRKAKSWISSKAKAGKQAFNTGVEKAKSAMNKQKAKFNDMKDRKAISLNKRTLEQAQKSHDKNVDRYLNSEKGSPQESMAEFKMNKHQADIDAAKQKVQEARMRIQANQSLYGTSGRGAVSKEDLAKTQRIQKAKAQNNWKNVSQKFVPSGGPSGSDNKFGKVVDEALKQKRRDSGFQDGSPNPIGSLPEIPVD